jgi:hypothetical protein
VQTLLCASDAHATTKAQDHRGDFLRAAIPHSTILEISRVDEEDLVQCDSESHTQFSVCERQHADRLALEHVGDRSINDAHGPMLAIYGFQISMCSCAMRVANAAGSRREE